jgi:hypothetical protein
MQRAFLIIVLASSIGVLPAPARAQSARPAEPATRAAGTPPKAGSPSGAIAESERLAARAFEAYQHADHAAARSLYEQALAAAPSADIVYNLARVCDLGLRDRVCALDHYARYVAEPGAVPSRTTLARRRLEALSDPPPASATGVQAAPPEPVMLRKPTPPPPAPSSVASADAPGLSAVEMVAVVAGTTGLVGVGLGVGFGLAARADLEASERYCDYDRCTSQRGVDAARSASRAADVATLGLAAGGALLSLGTLLWLLAGDAPEERVAARELMIEPGFGSDGVSLALSGSFGR